MEPEEKQTSRAEASAEEEGGSFFSDLMDIAESGFLTVFIVMMIFIYLIRRVTVDGSSMNPTLLHQDQIFIVASLYEPKNGQIVVIDDAESGRFADAAQQEVVRSEGCGITIVKRLIAKGGQEIDIDFENGDVRVDGSLLDEPYIADPTTRDEYAFQYPFTVPEGYVFVMGDNRLYSMDSRSPQVALIPEDEILGTALVRYDREKENRSRWTERFDYLF
ncbi:MAG: signal peptidase I [Oscillospiraceae bacterium]|nr:signal peptidase I [Oscillospiraceae bacterium]